ncbi:MAG: LysE family translocator [Alphaproteobacteria bacterium]
MEQLSGFLLAALALAGSPGPATLSVAAAGAAFGAARVVGYMAGIAVGMVVVMAIAAAGMVAALLAVPGAAPVIAVAVAIYFAWLSWRIATAPPLAEGAAEGRRAPTFAGGVALSLVNPKGYAAMAALFSGFVLMPGRPAADVAVKIAVLSAIVITVNVAWLAAGAALTGAFRRPAWNRAINVAFAVLLLASAVFALPL